MKSNEGFTLIELLLVLAIIGIISAIAIPALLHQQEKAKRTCLLDQTVLAVADLNSVLGELSDPPSERKIGYPTTIYSGTAADNQTKAEEAIAIVLNRPNLALAKNPYTGATGGYLADTAPASGSGRIGMVYLDASSAATTTDPVITVGGVFRNSKGNLETLKKTVALN